MFGELNNDVSNLRHNHPSAHFDLGKTLPTSERTNVDEITIHVLSRSSGKPSIARVAYAMANEPKWQQGRIGVRDLNPILEGGSL